MAKPKIKLAYISAQFRVKAEISRKIALSAIDPPEDVIARANKKMHDIQDAGEIGLYSVYKTRLIEFWKKLQKTEDIPDHEVLTISLAEGSPILEGIYVDMSDNQKAVAKLSIDADPMLIRDYRLEWFTYFINNKIRSLGGTRCANPAQVHGAWLKALNGEPVEDMLLGAVPDTPSKEESLAKPYSIIANKSREEVTLIIRDLPHIVQAVGVEKIINMIKEASTKVSQQFGGNYTVLQKEVSAAIKAGLSGPELVGVDLPLVVLGAVGVELNAVPQIKLDYPGAGKLDIVIDPDGMEAIVRSFASSVYEDKSFRADETWVKNELKRCGVHIDMAKPYLKEIYNNIAMKESLEGLTVATGNKSKNGSKPYLFANYQELKKSRRDEVEGEGAVNIRDLQQRSIVKVGELVATLRYEHPPMQGRDVYGKTLENGHGGQVRVNVGEGIEERSTGKFYATVDGIPNIEKTSISIDKVMLHKGDVNLRTGDIVFDGPVEITGSIDSGASVDVRGDLKVRGSIRNAFVRCGGDLEVRNGIITGEKGLVNARGEIKAEFIENSNIQCGGSLSVSKVLLNSNVISGGEIQVLNRESGVIAGGLISCRENLTTGVLAFKHGNVTELNIGVDWKAEISVRIRQTRMDKVIEVQSKDRNSLREVMARKKSQMTQKHEQRKKHFQDRLVRERALIEKCQQHLDQAKAQLVYDNEVRVMVFQTLHANVKVQVGGSSVAVESDMAGVALLGKRMHGSKIVSVETIIKMEKERLG